MFGNGGGLMATLFDNYSGTATPYLAFTMNSATLWGGQTFTAAVTFTLTRIDIWCAKGIGDNVGTIDVELYAVDGSGHPTGSALASGTIADASIGDTTSYAWVACTLSSSYKVVGGTKYAIVVHGDSLDASNTLTWSHDDDGAGSSDFAGGDRVWSVNGGSSWSVNTQNDELFRCYGNVAVPTDKTFSKKLVTAGNHEIWYESTAGTMTELAAANGVIDTSVPLTMFEYDEKVFVVNDDKFKVIDFGNAKITTADIVGGGDPPDFHTVLTGGTSGAKMVLDYTTAITGAATLYGKKTTTATFQSGETVTGTDDDGNAISFVLDSNEVAPTTPHWYDWTVFGNDSSYGVMPSNGYVGFNYRGRASITADKYYPHQVYQPRQRNPWDWNWVADDAQTPIRGGLGDAAEVGDIILTAIPYKDDILLYACSNTLWYQVGDLAEGGSVVELSLTGGILGAFAWCWDDNENLYILSTTGLLKIAKGFQAPQNLTRIIYPELIADLAYDPSLHRITMGYDRDKHGIIICRTLLSDGTNTGYWYDLTTEGLFPESHNAANGYFSMFWYEAIDPTYRKLIFGCQNGYLVYEDKTFKDDDTGTGGDVAIDSYFTVGPIALGQEGREGILHSILGVPAIDTSSGTTMDSNAISWKVWTGESADRVSKLLKANTSPRVSGTISGTGYIKGSRKRRKIRGMYGGIRVGNNTAAQTWALEKLLIDYRSVGRIK
jgi:hypothetical protein